MTAQAFGKVRRLHPRVRRYQFRSCALSRNRVAVVGPALGLIVASAIAAPLIAPYDPFEQSAIGLSL